MGDGYAASLGCVCWTYDGSEKERVEGDEGGVGGCVE